MPVPEQLCLLQPQLQGPQLQQPQQQLYGRVRDHGQPQQSRVQPRPLQQPHLEGTRTLPAAAAVWWQRGGIAGARSPGGPRASEEDRWERWEQHVLLSPPFYHSLSSVSLSLVLCVFLPGGGGRRCSQWTCSRTRTQGAAVRRCGTPAYQPPRPNLLLLLLLQGTGLLRAARKQRGYFLRQQQRRLRHW